MKVYINIDGPKVRLSADEVAEMFQKGNISAFNKEFVENIVNNKYKVTPFLHSHWDIGMIVEPTQKCKLTEKQISERLTSAAKALMDYYGFEFNSFSNDKKMNEFENMASLDNVNISALNTLGIHHYISAYGDDKKFIGSILVNNKSKNKDDNQLYHLFG